MSPLRRLQAVPVLLVLLCVVAVVQVVSMPGLLYAGDNFTPRIEAARWLRDGHLGMPYALKAQLPEMFKIRGQMFYEDDARQLFFSKFGIAYTVLYLPVVLLDHLWSGHLMAVLNGYNLLLTLVITVYLYLAAGLYTASRWLRAVFVLLAFYTSFVWFYLRAPALEIFQMAAFAGYGYHALRHLRQESRRHLLLAACYAGALLLMKSFFALLFVPLYLFAVATPRRWREIVLPLVLPSALFVGAWLLVNQYKFGAPLRMGYGQWLDAQGQPIDRFGLQFFLVALPRYLLRPGNANLFIHAPIFLFALLGWPRFLREHRREALFLLFVMSSTLLTLCFFSNWAGESCYGPRYLIHVMLFGSLPFVYVLAWAQRRWPALLLMAVVLGFSLQMQVYMNALEYFTFYRLREFFAQVKSPQINAYLDNAWCRGLLHRDLSRFVDSGAPYYPYQELERVVPPQRRDVLVRARAVLRELAQPNSFWKSPD